MTAEQKTADAILQRNTTLKIGTRSYQVAAPTIATLILASERIAKMKFDEPREEESQLEYGLRNARKATLVPEVLAILILGEKRAFAPETWTTKVARFLHLEPKTALQQLTNTLATQHTPKELMDAYIEVLSRMDVESFFAISTFLRRVNVIAPKKKVD